MQQAALFRRERQVVLVVWLLRFCCFGFRLRNQRDLRETLGFLICKLIEYSCVYSPADNADHAEECSKLHYHAEKDNLFEVKAVLGFRGLSA